MRWIAWLVVCACASGSSPGSRPASAPPPTGPPRDSPLAAAPPVAAAPTAHECDALIDHALALGASERVTRPADQLSTEADLARARTQLAPLRDECRTLPRARYECAIATGSLAELGACQATPSSSTSNSSVAPGGITPPAPRSP